MQVTLTEKQRIAQRRRQLAKRMVIQNNHHVVYPVFRKRVISVQYTLHNNNNVDAFETSDELVGILSSLDHVAMFCSGKARMYLKETDKPWWFTVSQEAVDGSFSGIGGICRLFDWDGKEFDPHQMPQCLEELLNKLSAAKVKGKKKTGKPKVRKAKK